MLFVFFPRSLVMMLARHGATNVVAVQSSCGNAAFSTSPANRLLVVSIQRLHAMGPNTSQNWAAAILGRLHLWILFRLEMMLNLEGGLTTRSTN